MKPMEMIRLVKSNGSAEGNSFAASFAQACREAQNAQDKWIAELRSNGVKAAHPDDGWVDRERNTVHFAYPQFNDGPGVGDKVALGQPDKYRIVTITRAASGLVLDRWAFSPND